ncbi:hypothetical protein CYY_006174 [Polysphondylium violaceum]|uniref:Uncharacterized protein n=1 Tax=Polysphondylium violaceum TaxID=133409 RepID=A0A8J4PS22_9MYCE|nr:hypothetical protein CYY_006174 [Polysphondylium violaceum]
MDTNFSLDEQSLYNRDRENDTFSSPINSPTNFSSNRAEERNDSSPPRSYHSSPIRQSFTSGSTYNASSSTSNASGTALDPKYKLTIIPKFLKKLDRLYTVDTQFDNDDPRVKEHYLLVGNSVKTDKIATLIKESYIWKNLNNLFNVVISYYHSKGILFRLRRFEGKKYYPLIRRSESSNVKGYKRGLEDQERDEPSKFNKIRYSSDNINSNNNNNDNTSNSNHNYSSGNNNNDSNNSNNNNNGNTSISNSSGSINNSYSGSSINNSYRSSNLNNNTDNKGNISINSSSGSINNSYSNSNYNSSNNSYSSSNYNNNNNYSNNNSNSNTLNNNSNNNNSYSNSSNNTNYGGNENKGLMEIMKENLEHVGRTLIEKGKIKDQFETMRKENKELKEKIEKIKAENDAMKIDIRDLKYGYTKLKDYHGNLKNDYVSLRDQMEHFKSEIQHLKANQITDQAGIKNLISRNEFLKSENQFLKSILPKPPYK